MTDGTQPFVTKNTIGLLTIDWNSNQVPEEEEKSPEVLAIEKAAREAIAERRKQKKKGKKSKSKSPTRKKEDPDEEAKRKKAAEEAEAKRLKEEEEARRLKEEAAARQKAQEEARRLKEEEEAARRRKEAEERRLKEEARRLKEAEENAKRLAEEQAAEDLAKAEYESMDASIKIEEEPKKPRKKQARRISCFPCTSDNDGLCQALRKYGSDVPFDWEKPEWTMNFGKLRHAETQKRTYGWERPVWARRNVLRRRHSFSDRRSSGFKPTWMKRFILKHTPAGDAVRQGINLEHSFSNSFASLNYSKNIGWEAPEWTSNPRLRTTEAGAVVRQGANLALPITKIKDFVASKQQQDGSSRDAQNEASYASSLGDSIASLDMSQKNIGWEKPSWASNPGLRRTSKGETMKVTGTLAKPITFPKGKNQ